MVVPPGRNFTQGACQGPHPPSGNSPPNELLHLLNDGEPKRIISLGSLLPVVLKTLELAGIVQSSTSGVIIPHRLQRGPDALIRIRPWMGPPATDYALCSILSITVNLWCYDPLFHKPKTQRRAGCFSSLYEEREYVVPAWRDTKCTTAFQD